MIVYKPDRNVHNSIVLRHDVVWLIYWERQFLDANNLSLLLDHIPPEILKKLFPLKNIPLHILTT